MNIRTELVYRAICSFYDDGYAYFTQELLNPAIKEYGFRYAKDLLIAEKAIEDCSINGYCRRFKIKDVVECPDFIFNNNFDNDLKLYLLQCWKDYQECGKVLSFKNSKETKIKRLGFKTIDIITNAKTIKNHLTCKENLEWVFVENKGYKLVNKIKPYYCKECGETDPALFRKNQHSICKACQRKKERRQYKSTSERLFKTSKSSAAKRGLEHTITQADIQKILDNQQNRCKYTGVEFGNDKNDKYTYPTIDRIDSSKGYTPENICICTFFVNMMKNNSSIEIFKDTIYKLYENIDNF